MNTQTNYFKKALVVLMAVMMVFTMMPGMAWAGTEEAGVPAEAPLSQLVFRNGMQATAAEFQIDPQFDSATKSYTVIAPDTVNGMNGFCAWARLADTASGKIVAEYTPTGTEKPITITLTSGKATGTTLGRIFAANSLAGNTFKIKVGQSEAYEIRVVRKATLKTLEVKKKNGEPITLTPAFNGNTNEYQAEVEGNDSLTVKAAATVAGAVIKVGEQEMKAEGVPITPVWNKHTADITITAGGKEKTDAVSSRYTIHLIQAIQSLEIETPPTKCTYNIGEKFNVAGLKVQAVYAGGTKQAIPNEQLTIKPNADAALGLNTSEITISYGAKSVSQPITVKSKLQGAGTTQSPYQLASENDFNTLRAEVAAGESFAGKHFKIMQDITFSQGWEPIGCLKEGTTNTENGVNILPFSGEIDGDAKTLTFANGSKPLFNYVREASVHDFNIAAPFMDGYALVEQYTVDYGEDGDYATGTGGSYEAGTPDTIEIANVTLKSGSIIKKGGFIGGFASGSNTVTMTNCTVEKDVKIGCNADGTSANDSQVGSFAGMVSGIFKNCVSYADVYGKDRVGGIVGYKGQSMGLFDVSNCRFEGNVYAAGDYAGGIVGAGYSSSSAPNTMCTVIKSCTVSENATINGKDYVGGILGAESAIQCWDNGIGEIQNNSFEGKIIASGQNVGGIIGYMGSLNRYTKIMNNYYQKGCGATDGIGKVQYVDTSDTKHETKSGAVYFDTSKSLPQVNDVSKLNHNRTDDPLGADKVKLCSTTKREGKYVIELQISGQCRTHYVNEALDLTGITLTAVWSDDTQTSVPLDDPDLKIIGYKPSQHGYQSVTLNYQGAETEIAVTVLYSSPKSASVTVTLLGDSTHGDDETSKSHGLAMGGLLTWIDKAKVDINTNSTVWDALQKLSGVTWTNPSGNYISSVTYNGTTIAEFTNGKNSGWMYTLNGTHPLLGVSEQYLKDGDEIVFHYTDDYTKEEGSDKWGVPGADEVKDVATSGVAGSATTMAPTEVKVSGTTATATIKAENQSEIIKQAAEKKSTEIILEVSAANTKGAESVQLSLDVTFVKNVADKTDADLTVNTENGKVTLDQETIKTVLAEAKGATITLEVTKVSKPTEVQKQAAGANGHLLKLTIKSGDKVISDFNKGKVKVVAEIVSKLLDKKVAAIHIADDGKIEQLAGKVLTIGGKKYYEFTTPHFSTFALVDADELGLEVAEEPTVDAKALTAKLTPVARSAKTAKKNVKVTVSLDKQDKAIIKELKDAGYTVKYRFYRSTKKAAGYKAAVTKKTASYTNTSGKKGTKYYYKVQVRVYDANGKLTAKTALKQCRYAARVWSK